MRTKLIGVINKNEHILLNQYKVMKLTIWHHPISDIGQKYGSAVSDYEFSISFCSQKRKYKI